MRTLKGASLLEAIVAAAFFLTIFAVVLELLPRITVRDDDALLVAEAEYRTGRAYTKYATGGWPCGEYTESYDWGELTIYIAFYRNVRNVQLVKIRARIDGSRKNIVYQQLVECHE